MTFQVCEKCLGLVVLVCGIDWFGGTFDGGIVV